VTGAGSTQTASAGGYGIPVSSGEYTVTATLPEGQVAVRTVTVGAENRKIDFLRSEFTASPRIIGETSGIYTITATADETLTLKLNTTNAAGDTPVYEWICLTVIPAAGPAYPIFILTESGLSPLSPDSDLETLAWSPGISPTFDLGTLSLADLGLTPGDALLYGYAYTASTPAELTLENLVTIQIVGP